MAKEHESSILHKKHLVYLVIDDIRSNAARAKKLNRFLDRQEALELGVTTNVKIPDLSVKVNICVEYGEVDYVIYDHEHQRSLYSKTRVAIREKIRDIKLKQAALEKDINAFIDESVTRVIKAFTALEKTSIAPFEKKDIINTVRNELDL